MESKKTYQDLDYESAERMLADKCSEYEGRRWACAIMERTSMGSRLNMGFLGLELIKPLEYDRIESPLLHSVGGLVLYANDSHDSSSSIIPISYNIEKIIDLTYVIANSSDTE